MFHAQARLAAATPFAAVTLALAACGQASFTTEEAVESFQVANPDASLEQSQCVVDLLVEQYSLDELETELRNEPLAATYEEAQFRSMFRCGLEGDVEAQITELLVDTGVDADDAPCVSAEFVDSMTDEDIDVLLSGAITEEFSTKFLESMDACGALNP